MLVSNEIYYTIVCLSEQRFTVSARLSAEIALYSSDALAITHRSK
jgi:hypothetical protein